MLPEKHCVRQTVECSVIVIAHINLIAKAVTF